MKAPKNIVIAVIVTAVVAGGAGFFGGMKFGTSQNANNRNVMANGQFGANSNRQGSVAANRLKNGGGFINGEILSKDDKSITVKDRTGGSKIIFFAPSTTIGKTTDGTSSDLTIGQTVMASGTANSDGSVTAQSIQIRPAGSQDFGGPGGRMMINGGIVAPNADGTPNNK